MNKLYFYCLALFVAPTFSAFGQTQPSQDENGYYLIESAEHLKWFRDQVNASEHEQVDTNGDGQINMDDDTVVRLNAKLTADIDLGGESVGVIPTPEWKLEHFRNTPEEAVWKGGDMTNMIIGQGYVQGTERPADRRAAVVRAVRLCRLGCGEEPRHSWRHGHFQSR